MNILYYVTSHGFGHAVRTAAICNCFNPGVNVTFRTAVPEHFFKEELTVPFKVLPAEFDCGCIQSDGVTVDIEKTLTTYAQIAARNDKRVQDEVALCKELGADCIVSDITPFAFQVAHLAGIPSVAVANFTWYDIYSHYTENYPWFIPELNRMKQQYGMANALLSLEPSIEMEYFGSKQTIPVVGRKGVCRREEICKLYGIKQEKHLGLIYTGNFGLDTVLWHKLELFSDWEFLGVYPLKGNPANFHLIRKADCAYQNLSASVDVIICKLGYGVLSESFLNGVPLIFLPRSDFAEYPVLEKEVLAKKQGCKLESEDFFTLKWHDALKKALLLKPNCTEITNFGAQMCAAEIEKVARKQIQNHSCSQ